MITQATYDLFDEDSTGFRIIRHASGSADVVLCEKGVRLTKRHFPARWETEHTDEFSRVLDFWLSAARAIIDDRDAGWVRECLAEDRYANHVLGISMEFDPWCCPNDPDATVLISLWDPTDPDATDLTVEFDVSKDDLWDSVREMDAYYPTL